MKTLTLYIARELSATTAFVFTALVMLFAFFDLVQELGDFGRGNYRLVSILLYVLLSIPGHVYDLFPVAALIGAMFTLARLAATSEYAVMRASGMSLIQAGSILMAVGLVFSALTFLVGEYIAPESNRLAQELRLAAQSKVVAREFRSGLWVKDETSFINVKHLTPEKVLREVHIYEFDDEYRLREISSAQTGTYDDNNRWLLEDVTKTQFDEGRTQVTSLTRDTWHSVLTPDLLSLLVVVPEQMSAANLITYIQHLRENKQQTLRYEVALWSKYSYPFAVLALMLITVPFASLQRREGGVGAKVFTAIMLGVAFHFLNRLFTHLGLLNSWPPALTAIIPTALFFATAIILIWSVERR
ncbi:MAG: LPS export ABC transporter permease LptG [Burkholderiales bacterium]